MKAPALLPLTSLRFFAALAIVVYHLQGTIVTTPSHNSLALGVSFFFVLSGFILTYVYRDMSDTSVGRFYQARFARVWPLHLVTTVLVMVFFVRGLSHRPGLIPALALNTTLLQAWVPVNGIVFSLNAVSWSISAELGFYLVFPLLARTRHFSVWYACIALGVLGIVLGVQATVVDYENDALWTFSPIHLLLHNPACRMLEFATGVAAGKLFLSGCRIPRMSQFGTLLEVVVLALAVTFAGYSQSLRQAIISTGCVAAGEWFGQAGGVGIFAAVIFVFAHSSGLISRGLSWKPMVLLGEISFATYMVHQIVIRYCVSKHLVERAGHTMAAVVIVGVTYAGSWVLWMFVELPSRRAIGQVFRQGAP
jgi:peptidoglycan/LPS O-acetylase OafA/YrhL